MVVLAAACGGGLSIDDRRGGPAPFVKGGDVTFVEAGTAADPPRIVADFNGWDANAGTMKPSGDGWYTLQVQLDPAARVEYLIAYKDRFEIDPRNALTVRSPTGAPRSELRMPGYRVPSPLPRPETPGTVENVPFTSRSGEGRHVRVHRHPDVTRPTPLLYVHDGIIAVEQLDMPAILDGLVAANQMAPITTVFINSVDRHDDFAVGSIFRDVFTGEIVPMIEERYRLEGARSVLGFSRSTVGALDAALNGSVTFGRAGLVAPAMDPPTRGSLVKAPRERPHVTILAGTYDIPLIEDAQALRSALQVRTVPQEWFEVPEGHNHTAWRTQLRRLLVAWYPPE